MKIMKDMKAKKQRFALLHVLHVLHGRKKNTRTRRSFLFPLRQSRGLRTRTQSRKGRYSFS
ncbi:MAG: hypothetical protein ACOWWM_19210, partial [Desulfobacterales bacterium]